jgi:hypothetical protein
LTAKKDRQRLGVDKGEMIDKKKMEKKEKKGRKK